MKPPHGIWEPAGNLDSAAQAIKDWGEMHTEEQTRIMGMSDVQLNDWYDDNDDSVPLADVLSTEADVCLVQNLFDVPWGEMIDLVCKRSGISKEQVGIVFASPPCETFSSADASNISRDNFHRDHDDPTKPPRKLEGCTNPAATAKRTKALQHDYMVKNMFQSFFKDKSEGYDYKMIVENPVGSLRKRPYMLGERMEKEFTRTTVDYCAFGKPYRKSTDIWTTFDWMPNGCTGSGRCDNGDCGQGTRNTKGKFKHRRVIGGENDRRVCGPHVKKQLWSIPEKLTSELMCAAMAGENCKHTDTDTDTTDRTVKYALDLFSGGESWKALAEQNGYVYIPVDLKTLST